MRDAVTTLIKSYDDTGRYLTAVLLSPLSPTSTRGLNRVKAATMISATASSIVKEAGSKLFEQVPELIRPGGNAYTTRRYAACLRDMDYYLRYGSYALVAGDSDLLDERVLTGLRETYNSLGVPIAPTVIGIQIMKEIVKAKAQESGIEDASFIDQPFDYMCRELSELSV